jgi:hypothetical protein
MEFDAVFYLSALFNIKIACIYFPAHDQRCEGPFLPFLYALASAIFIFRSLHNNLLFYNLLYVDKAHAINLFLSNSDLPSSALDPN